MTPIQGPNRDFASELYINKLVNGQVRDKLDKTVSSGSRRFSAALHSDANDMNHVSTGLENAQVYAMSRQDVMTEVQHALDDMKKILGDALASSGGANPPAGSGTESALKDAMDSLRNNIASLLNSKDFDGVGLFEAKGKTFDGGMGVNMQVGGDASLDTLESALGTDFNDALTETTINYANLYTLMDEVLGATKVEIADMAAEISMLDTRAQAIDNMSTSLRNTADTSFVIVTQA